MASPIPVPELARRLCVRNHPHLATTFQQVPCGEHLRQGNLYALLTTEPGRHTFEVIRDARDEFLGEDSGYSGILAAVRQAEQDGLKVHVGLQESCEANIEAGPVAVAAGA